MWTLAAPAYAPMKRPAGNAGASIRSRNCQRRLTTRASSERNDAKAHRATLCAFFSASGTNRPSNPPTPRPGASTPAREATKTKNGPPRIDYPQQEAYPCIALKTIRLPLPGGNRLWPQPNISRRRRRANAQNPTRTPASSGDLDHHRLQNRTLAYGRRPARQHGRRRIQTCRSRPHLPQVHLRRLRGGPCATRSPNET